MEETLAQAMEEIFEYGWLKRDEPIVLYKILGPLRKRVDPQTDLAPYLEWPCDVTIIESHGGTIHVHLIMLDPNGQRWTMLLKAAA